MESDSSSRIKEWVDNYSDYLLGFALTKINDRSLALDLVQDTFLSAIKSEDSFEGRSSAKTWLTSILNRKIIDFWRKQKARKTDAVSHYSSAENEGDWILESSNVESINVEDQLINAENSALLFDCLEKLPEKSKDILVAKYFEQKKGEEICNEFGITSSNMWVMVHRAKSLLRDCLKENNYL